MEWSFLSLRFIWDIGIVKLLSIYCIEFDVDC